MADAAIDSIKSASRYERKKKLYQSAGRLHKGASASIPSKFRTIVDESTEQKGFGSCCRRFNADQILTEGPAPCHYQNVVKTSNDCVSLSKKGTGTFASKSKRFQIAKRSNALIAPGQYNPLQRHLTDFNKAPCTSNFHLPIAVKRDPSSVHSTPAPNQYNLPNKLIGRISHDNNVTACAVFKSRSRRDLLQLRSNNENPAPGTYTLNETVTKANPRHATAPFKSKTNRIPVTVNSIPGPGSYKPFEAVTLPDRKRLPRQHYLCIAAPAMPLPPSPPPPGPGHYNIVNYEGEPRKFVSGSAFVSVTGRFVVDVTKESLFEPGPATYNPQSNGKQSFIYNVDSRWI